MIIYTVFKRLMLKKCSYFSQICSINSMLTGILLEKGRMRMQSNVLRVNLTQFQELQKSSLSILRLNQNLTSNFRSCSEIRVGDLFS